jgi:hypothetical protein
MIKCSMMHGDNQSMCIWLLARAAPLKADGSLLNFPAQI